MIDSDWTAYKRGFIDGRMEERELLYVTIDGVIAQWSINDNIGPETFRVMESSLRYLMNIYRQRKDLSQKR